ncbi:MAG: carbohydrate binding family 9 domain-containing protein [Lewinellaceae bacterium]|nr:carbohydrate binding family 9 domain-containing protein [Phaeodactylibacter sp.]MCB9041085.1 carbohydrate binding family 9 domain-containing protein [Lewinellaceae bacterium]
MKVQLLWPLLCAGLLAGPLDAQQSPTSGRMGESLRSKEKKSYTTAFVQESPPAIDGKLDDAAWSQVEWGEDFIQFQPYNGEAPTQETAFKILHDDKNLYIGFRCYDTEPGRIVRRMSRRDGFEGDWVEINIDSYHDKRSAFSFTISVSGVKGDEFVSDNGNNWDPSWNPIWYAKTSIDSLGWVAEVRIPLSQIRYANDPDPTWGIQLTRRDFREESRSTWQFIERNDPNWVSSFGELRGLKGVRPQKQIEIQPYILAQAKSFEKEEGNPFATGHQESISAGVDGKLGVTSDLTLDFTINPDFGQVEADPSALTLDGFRIFFPERRPFFIENRNLFDYQVSDTWAGGPFGQDNLFYSRRIGGAPHSSPSLEDGEYADVPDNTSILGAAKFSGKTRNGLGLGILEAVTAREIAEVAHGDDRTTEVAEPFTNFFVGRVSQDFREGGTVLGGMMTATLRDQSDADLTGLHRSAYTGGVDLAHWWKDRTYLLSVKAVGSSVQGSPEVIHDTQTAFEHLFQRSDADHLEVDSMATALNGHGGTLRLGKLNGRFVFDGGVAWRSPGLEINDIGFMRNADEINHFYWMGYRLNDPFSVFRNMSFFYNHAARWDFGGNALYQRTGVGMSCFLKSFWSFETGVDHELSDYSNNDLRGGPTLKRSKGLVHWMGIGSDRRKKLFAYLNVVHAWGFEHNAPRTVAYRDYSLNLTLQPANAFNISISPSFSNEQRKLQYITEEAIGESPRYIAGFVDQRTFYATVRLNYNITPNLTVQYYGQPFISKGNYRELKYITDSKAGYFYDRFHLFTEQELSFDAEGEIFQVDENLDGMVDYTFDEPDFNFIQFRSNLVLRWEYIPGSELFLVWSQSNTASGEPGERLLPSLTDRLFSEKMQNIFLVKATYRFLR